MAETIATGTDDLLADLEDGILTITLSRADTDKPKAIRVRSA